MQNFGRPETTLVAQEKKASIEKEQKAKENRAVESAEEGAEAKRKAAAETEQKENPPIKVAKKEVEAEPKPDLEKKEEEKKTSAHMFEEGRVIFEKYNNSGDVILRLPPAKKPVDEMV